MLAPRAASILELEFVKRELYNQINVCKDIEIQKRKLNDEMKRMEDEMELTIESYKHILESQGKEEETDIVKIRKELLTMQRQIESLSTERYFNVI